MIWLTGFHTWEDSGVAGSYSTGTCQRVCNDLDQFEERYHLRSPGAM